MKSSKSEKSKPVSDVSSLPVHSLETTEQIIHVRPIEYNNPYDFTREHRHDYFEILFFDTGGGEQLIDFVQHPVVANSCYIVFPQQIHLLKRNNATGTLVQFGEEIIPSAQIKNLLRQVLFGEKSAIIFENSVEKIEEFKSLLTLIQHASERGTKVSNDSALHLLQALLLQLVENRDAHSTGTVAEDQQLLFHFQQLLEEQYTHNHSVQEYVNLTGTTEKKLAAATKKYTGLSPLQVIHNRVLLEAKRILLFEDTSHKEIAFRLGFDSPASFSQFIKNKTGYSPSELSTHLVDIHK
jgi:AraC family transcriptional regulator, transcriptional activator of pobA